MTPEPIAERIARALEGMPEQLRSAGRYVLDHPRDVALLSMREQARRAGLPPATMTRFAQRLGLAGYDEVRSAHADVIRRGGLGFAGKASEQVTSQLAKGAPALAVEMARSLAEQVARLAEPETVAALVSAAERLHSARRVFCLGLRACHPVAWQVNYMLSLVSERATLLDGAGGVGTDAIRAATAKDVLLVASVRPYTRATVEVARYAAERGVPVVALTDSKASPLAAIAQPALHASTDGPSFLHALTPLFALAEMLATLAAGRAGEDAPKALARTEAQLAAFGVHWEPSARRRRPPAASAA